MNSAAASIIEPHRDALTALCRCFGVRTLELFGSASSGLFDAQNSDIDFLLDLAPDGDPDLFSRYFGLKEALERLFGRTVDLVMVGALRNPYFIKAVNQTRQPVHGAHQRAAQDAAEVRDADDRYRARAAGALSTTRETR